MLVVFPLYNLLTSVSWVYGVVPTTYFQDIWEAICELLLHPHTWLRNVSSRVVAFYFASANKAIKQDHEKSLGMFFLMRPSRVFMIAVSLCCQLETEVIDDAMSNLITHNLATASFVTHILMGRMECADPCKFWSALDQHEQGQFLEAFQLLDPRKGRGMLLHVISGVRRHDNVNQSDNLQYFLVSNLLKKMGDIALLKDAIQVCPGKSSILIDKLDLDASDICTCLKFPF